MRTKLQGFCACVCGISLAALLVACGSSPGREDVCCTDRLAQEAESQQDETEPAPAAGPTTIACAPGTPIQVRVAPDLDTRALAPLEQALQSWETALEGKVTFHLTVDARARSAYRSCNIYVVWDEERDEAYGSAAVKPNAGARTTASAVLYFHRKVIGDRMDDTELVHALVMHELGHVLGLEHDESRDHETVMWPFITVPGQIGCEDVRRACTIWSCTPSCAGNGWLTVTD